MPNTNTMHHSQSIELNFEFQNKHYEGEAIPAFANQGCLAFPAYDIFLDDEYNGTIVKTDSDWTSDNHLDKGLLVAIGSIVSTLSVTV